MELHLRLELLLSPLCLIKTDLVLCSDIVADVLVAVIRDQALHLGNCLPRLVGLILGLLSKHKVPLLGQRSPHLLIAPQRPLGIGLRLLERGFAAPGTFAIQRRLDLRLRRLHVRGLFNMDQFLAFLFGSNWRN